MLGGWVDHLGRAVVELAGWVTAAAGAGGRSWLRHGRVWRGELARWTVAASGVVDDVTTGEGAGTRPGADGLLVRTLMANVDVHGVNDAAPSVETKLELMLPTSLSTVKN